MSPDADPYPTLRAFWPFYLSQHLHPVNRALHALGSLSGLTWLALAVSWGAPLLVLAGVVNGYALAWLGHFVFEKNRPATFRYPLKSFLCDWLLLAYTLSGRAGAEVRRLGLGAAAAPPPREPART